MKIILTTNTVTFFVIVIRFYLAIAAIACA
jgi:hypothetical protein